MKTFLFTTLLLIFTHFSFASGSNTNKSQALCHCSADFSYGGYSFNFLVAYESSNGCDPCFATDSYGGIFTGGTMIAEGIPSVYGLGLACGVNMQYCAS
jgi:hypothetical protein